MNRIGIACGVVVIVAHLMPTLLPAGEPTPPKRVAAVVTEYRTNSHAEVIVSRLLQTQTLDGKGEKVGLQLVSLFTDQVPKSDISRQLAAEYKFPIYDSVAGALTLGTGKLAVEGVLLVAEHGDYPLSLTGNRQYPKRRLFEQVVQVFRESGRSVPVFCDKHLADNWEEAKWFYDTARELKIPLMAGSSLPSYRREPPADVRRGVKLKQVLGISYHTLDAYGFHALEMVQCLAERRAGDETGIKSVQTLVDDAVWTAGEQGVYDAKLLDAALSRLTQKRNPKNLPLRDLVKKPVLWIIDYADGLRACILTLNGAVGEFSAAWRYADDSIESTLFAIQEERPFMHFAYLLAGIDRMMHTGQPAWPVERTLLTSGALDALLLSKQENSRRVETAQLKIPYRCKWDWKQPAD